MELFDRLIDVYDRDVMTPELYDEFKGMVEDELTKNVPVTRNKLRRHFDKPMAMYKLIRFLDENYYLPPFFPLLEDMKSFKHEVEHHPEGGVFEHSLQCLKLSRSKDAITNFCILYHDAGKVATHKMEDGKNTYKGHGKVGAVMAYEARGPMLGREMDWVDTLSFICGKHMLMHNLDKLKKSSILDLTTSPYWEILKNVHMVDILSRLRENGEEDVNNRIQYAESIHKQYMKTEEDEKKFKTLINGKKIIDKYPGLPGIFIGNMKQSVRESIIEKNFNVTDEEVQVFMEEIYAEREKKGLTKKFQSFSNVNNS